MQLYVSLPSRDDWGMAGVRVRQPCIGSTYRFMSVVRLFMLFVGCAMAASLSQVLLPAVLPARGWSDARDRLQACYRSPLVPGSADSATHTP